MPISLALSFLLATASPQADAAPKPDEMFCGEAMSIYLPEPQGTPAPNIKLENFQYMSPDDRCGRNINNDELMRLHKGIKPIAAASFGSSNANFGVMVRYTLTPDKPATFDMQTSDASEAEKERLTQFYNQAAALRDFHSSQGTVYVVFRYLVSPAQPSELPNGG
ncbi:hypothetical protein [uncultured Xanthomonas sp.]|uniref:hypothetical protein n=1 Tax=uncultured Xanthomonas sp. TaxID=152831 RepID=UPI0025D0D5CE|nr:hypothetical protein [uncultured Xanthomonas sp.]